MLGAIVVVSLAVRLPFEAAAGAVLIAEICAAGTLGGAALLRRSSKPSRAPEYRRPSPGELQRTQRVTAELLPATSQHEQPQRLALPAPSTQAKELETWHT